jgi:hypothetical protein
VEADVPRYDLGELRVAAGVVGRPDEHDVFERRRASERRLDARPEIGPGARREGHEDLRARRREQGPERGAFEERVERHDDAGGLAAPDREMGLGQVRQHQRDDGVVGRAEAMEEVGRLRDAGHERAVRPRLWLSMRVHGREEAQRGRVRIDRRAAPDELVGARRQLRRAARLDGLDVHEARNPAHSNARCRRHRASRSWVADGLPSAAPSTHPVHTTQNKNVKLTEVSHAASVRR